MADLLAPGMALKPDAVAIQFEDRSLTYREMDDAASRVANGLIELGIKPLDRVAIHVDNRPEFIMIHLGVMRTGATLVPTNIMYTGEEMEHILTDSGVKVLFILAAASEKLDKVNVPELGQVIEVGDAQREGSISLADFMAKSSAERPDVMPDPDGCAFIQYTSGTTGKPKGAMLSHANVLAVIRNTEDLPGSPEGIEGDVSLLVLPLFHSYGLNLVITRLFLSVQKMILVGRFDADQIFSLFEKYKVTGFAGAPPMYFAFVNTPGLDKYDVSSLRMAGSGAAPLPVAIMDKFKALTGIQISEGYGLSETAPTLTSNACGPVTKPGTVGPPIKEVEIRIVDEKDNDVPLGEVGEVIARGPNIFMGYWNRKKETEEAMRGGWFHTGDMGKFDEDGYLTIVDRMKDMIVVSGFNV
ncbi:MAG: AMP-binding protein, partial [Candidatus Hydrogenedentes bacterium]|nr:AMP-binding protein [Candidatus Hydrogenedentota bacterium]